MIIKTKRLFIAAAVAAVFSQPRLLCAAGTFCPPAQVPVGRLNLSVWSASGSDEFSFSATAPHEISVGGVRYTSVSETVFDVWRRTRGLGAKAVYNPSDTVDFVFGVFTGPQELAIATIDGENILAGDGSRAAFGVRKIVQPATIATPSVAIQWMADHSHARFGNMKVAAVTSAVDAVLTTAEYSVAAIYSEKRNNLEPWAAIKVTRVYSELNDRASFLKVKGVKDRVSLSAGLKINFRAKPSESLFIEAGLAPERYTALGLSVGF